MKRNRLATVAALWAGTLGLPAMAADHAESPTVTADPAADIADVFIFRPDQGLNRVVAAVSFAGRPSTAAGGQRIDGPTLRCDRNVLYVFNIDNTADSDLDATPDLRVLARLARNSDGQCGVQIEGIPGTGGRVIAGRTDTILTDGASGLRVFAGLVEDPFFFDTIGFGQTLASFAGAGQSGTINFDNTRDTFGGRNLSMIVFEMELTAALGGIGAGPVLQFWGDTYRFPGTQP